MSTMKYKATERYEMGWTDPRGISMLGTMKLNGGKPTGLEDIATSVLRDLWMAQFGERAVTFNVMDAASQKDETNVAQELANRHLVEQRKVSRMDMERPMYYYILLNDTYANR